MRNPFPSTQWSVVQQFGASAHPEARRAMTTLLEQYWRPLYRHLRHPKWGLNPDDAQDMLQEFCALLLERPEKLGGADPTKGRFRNYVRTALDHFLLNQLARAKAQKRGGGTPLLSLDFSTDDCDWPEPSAGETPADLMLREWARTVLDESFQRLEQTLEEEGKRAYGQALRLSFEPGTSYQDIATQLGISETDVKNFLHRTKKRLGATLMSVVLPTVSGQQEAQEEIQELMQALQKR